MSSRARESGTRIALVLASLAIALLTGEAGLRLAGFSYALAPQGVEFGWPDPVLMTKRYVTDPDLFWVTRDYGEKLARLRQTTPDLVLMGDSCTEFTNYPARLIERIRSLAPESAFTAEHVAAGGWTTYQGLQQLKRDIAPLRPRAIVIYYGWNDHWLGFGVEDEKVRTVTRSPIARFGRLRLAQLLVKTRMASMVGDRSQWPYRVPPGRFRENMRELCRLTREAGSVPVLVTAPTSHEPGHEPGYLAERFLNDPGVLVPLHQEYVSIVREVATGENALLCDLAAIVAELPSQERTILFRDDGIHFTEAGDEKVADLLLQCLLDEPSLRSQWSISPEAAVTR